MEREFLTPEQKKATKEGGLESKLNVDFEKLLEERDKLMKIEILQTDRIMYILAKLNDKEIDQSYNKVVERIINETKAFNELKETGIIYSFTCGIENGKYKADLEFVEEDSERMKELKKIGLFSNPEMIACLFFHKEKPEKFTAFISGRPPSKKEMWFDLTFFGIFRDIRISCLEHELIHRFQYPEEVIKKILIQNLIKKFISLAGYMPGLKRLSEETLKKIINKKSKWMALGEIQAYKTTEIAGLMMPPFSNSKLIEHLKKRYFFKETDVLISGVIEIERLKTLGVSDEKIGKLIGQAKWDEKTATFPLLEKEIERLSKEKGLDLEDLDNLVIAKKLEREIEFHKARIIAQEELKKLAEEKGILKTQEELKKLAEEKGILKTKW